MSAAESLLANPLIADTIAIAERAGEVVMAAFGSSDLAVRTKSDDSPQSQADRDASTLITRALRERFDEPVVSEEERVAWELRRDWSTSWLVDPLDGSREFLNGIEEFAVCIARIQDGAPTHGVILMPATGVVYAAERGAGAIRRDADGTVHALPLHQPAEPVVALSRYHDLPETRAFAERHGYHQFRPTGSALKFGLLAEGSIALYPRFEECKEWDTAAGHLILTEAGGGIADLVVGGELVYNKPRFPNNAFIASAPGVDLAALLEDFATV